MLKEYLEIFSKKFKIPKDQLLHFQQSGILKTFKAGEYLVHQGSPTQTLYLIIAGIIRSYSFENGKEWSSTFFKEGDVAGDFNGLIKENLAERSLITLEATTCFCIPFMKLKKQLQSQDWVELSIGEYMKTEYFQRASLKMEILSLKPEDRYSYIKKHLPWLSERVSDRYIACYIGVTPVSYSRIKKRFQI
jgi:CRP-like cAMP-binding protein